MRQSLTKKNLLVTWRGRILNFSNLQNIPAECLWLAFLVRVIVAIRIVPLRQVQVDALHVKALLILQE
jgi:hypothetical protein